MKAIPTEYRGGAYRSRLEARWAAFFDIVGWKYTYEPFDADGYIPDFVIHGDRPLLIEIKPAVTATDYRAPIIKIGDGIESHWRHDVLILGVTPTPNCFQDGWGDLPVAGLLGEYCDLGFADWQFETGCWCVCGKCRQLSVFHSHQSWHCRPCGHHDGDSYLNSIPGGSAALEKVWSKAGSSTQWKAQAAR